MADKKRVENTKLQMQEEGGSEHKSDGQTTQDLCEWKTDTQMKGQTNGQQDKWGQGGYNGYQCHNHQVLWSQAPLEALQAPDVCVLRVLVFKKKKVNKYKVHKAKVVMVA